MTKQYFDANAFLGRLREPVDSQLMQYVHETEVKLQLRSSHEVLADVICDIQDVIDQDPFGKAVTAFCEKRQLPFPVEREGVESALVSLYIHHHQEWDELKRVFAASRCRLVDLETPDFMIKFPRRRRRARINKTAIEAFETFLNEESLLDSPGRLKAFSLNEKKFSTALKVRLVDDQNVSSPDNRKAPLFFAIIFPLPDVNITLAHFVTRQPFAPSLAHRVMEKALECYYPGATLTMTNELNEYDKNLYLPHEKPFEPFGPNRFFDLTRLRDPDFQFAPVDGQNFGARISKLALSPGGKNWEIIEFSNYNSWANVASEINDLMDKADFARSSWRPVAATIELDLGMPFGKDRHCEIEITRTRCKLDRVPPAAREGVEKAIRAWGLTSPAMFSLFSLSELLRFPKAGLELGMDELGGQNSVWISERIFERGENAPGVLCPCGCGQLAPVKGGCAICPTSSQPFCVGRTDLAQWRLSKRNLATWLAKAFHSNGTAEQMTDEVFQLRPRKAGEKDVYFIVDPNKADLETRFNGKESTTAIVSGRSNPPAVDRLAIRPMTDFFDDEFMPDKDRIVEFLTTQSPETKLDEFGEADKRRTKVTKLLDIIRDILWSCYRWRRDQFDNKHRLPGPLTKNSLMAVLAKRMLSVDLPAKERTKWNERYTLVVTRKGKARKGSEKQDQRLLMSFKRELNRYLVQLRGGEPESISSPQVAGNKRKTRPQPINDSAEFIMGRKLWDACVAGSNDFFRASQALGEGERGFRRKSMPNAENISNLTGYADGLLSPSILPPTSDDWDAYL